MRIAVSTAFCGGVGGLERAICTLASALSDHRIDIYATHIISNGFVPRGNHVRVLAPTAVQPEPVDLYLYYATERPVSLLSKLSPSRSAIVPCGNDVTDIEHQFDWVICESQDNAAYYNLKHKAYSLTPCVGSPCLGVRPELDLPERFFLTVFNPYSLVRDYDDVPGEVKGQDQLYRVADHLSVPLVWCRNDSTKTLPEMPHHPNIVPVLNLDQDAVYYLYQRALAYVCFSREEGFGWAVADAMVHQLPIISRRIGVLTSLTARETGHFKFETINELIELLKRTEFTPARYDLSRFSRSRFRRRLLGLMQRQPGSQELRKRSL